jgi:hypothetical protein
MESLWIVVPIGAREIYIENLLLKLSAFKDRIVFVNNNEGYTKFDSVHHIEDFEEVNIYRWWNKGILYAKNQGAKHVAVLNDDIDFDSTFIPQLYSHLVSNNLAIVDTDNTGNGGGVAWMMDLSFGLLLNEHFRWWYGDTEIFDRAKKIKKFARVKATGHFVHHEPNNLMHENQILTNMSFVDATYYNRLNDLKTIYSKYSAGYGSGGGDKGTAHDYIGTYAKYLSNRTNIDFLEIGVFRGDSIKMWNEYFVDSTVLGIDISLDMVSYPDLKNVMICDATLENEIASKLGEKLFDYIIDDGSHIVGDQIASFDILFKRMKQGGIYFIEDILGDANLNQLKNHVDSLDLKYMVFDTRSEYTTDNDLILAIFKG